jgi:hypothetical protein
MPGRSSRPAITWDIFTSAIAIADISAPGRSTSSRVFKALAQIDFGGPLVFRVLLLRSRGSAPLQRPRGSGATCGAMATTSDRHARDFTTAQIKSALQDRRPCCVRTTRECCIWVRSFSKDVEKSFGDVSVLRDINLTIEDGEFVVFVGPSGCGKSTLLRMITGLETVTAGQVVIDGEDMTHTKPSTRAACHGVPVLRPVSAYLGARQHRLRSAHRGVAQGLRSPPRWRRPQVFSGWTLA